EIVAAIIQEILPKPQIDFLLPRRPSLAEEGLQLTVVFRANELDDVVGQAGSEGAESTELDAPQIRKVGDEVRDDLVALIVARRVTRVRTHSHAREAEQVSALGLGLR